MNINYKSLMLAVSVYLAFTASISAPPGDLDLTFSGDGKLLDWLSRGDDGARAVAIQPDGKIVVVGTSWTGLGSYDFAVARYNIDGSLDTTFGTGGKVTTDFNSSYDQASSVAIQPDGKIVLAGSSQINFALVRYKSDGSLDTSFGANGRITTDFNSGATANSVAIQTDGKIVAVGGCTISGGRGAFAAARYNTDGSLDTSFDSDGKVTTEFTSSSGIASSVAIQDDGKIVAAGPTSSPSNFTLVRYRVDGSLDTSFDGDGKVTTPVGTNESRALSVAIQGDGKIVAAGYAFLGFGLVRYSSNGSPENVTTIQISSPFGGVAASVAIQPDGKIVAAGYGGSNSSFAVVRLNANFSIDTTFGTNGKVTTPIGGATQAAVQADGKIVASGSGPSDTNSEDFVVVRYNANGLLDTSFDGDGKVTTDFGFFYGNVLQDAVVQPDGKIVAAGGVRGDFAVLRYNPDGSPDAAFGSGTGKVRTGMASSDQDGASGAVAIQTDGKIVVAGDADDGNGNGCGFALARYNSDGSLDTTFGGGGRVFTGCFDGTGIQDSSGASDIAIQPDGKIVAAGSELIRYNPDGSRDTSFDGDGIVTTAIGYFIAQAVAIQSDGKIVAAGYSYNTDFYSGSFTLARYNPDGSLDTTFDGDGKVTTVIGTSSYAASVAIQSDGKIVAAGISTIGSNYDIAVVRYTPNGSLDVTFDSDGIVTTAIGSGDDTASSVAIDRSGKLVVAGTSSGDFALLRYLSNGSLDTTFGGGDGISTIDFGNSNDQANGMALDGHGRAVVVGTSDGRFAIARVVGDPIQTPTCPNPIDCPDFFIRQQYLDFLGREPDANGFANWMATLGGCPNGGFGEFDNPHCDRVHVSAGFYQSEEFQARGFWAYRFYEGALDRRPTFAEFIPDMLRVGGPQSPQSEATSKAAYTNDFVLKQEFRNRYDSLSNAAYLNALEQNAEVTLTNKQTLLDALNAGTKTRAVVLREVVEDQLVFNRFFNRGFVSMQYFGYLRRDPDTIGFQNWVNTLDANPNNFRHMIFGFIYSAEYRARFGQP